ncbi:hypothetical protein [Pendulispora albinea]|uniref:Uncharacterized protein n=1 Tax=Pendulispora albinea TaxID=2741071 RepID=A0ABZ2M7T6_9BACT
MIRKFSSSSPASMVTSGGFAGKRLEVDPSSDFDSTSPEPIDDAIASDWITGTFRFGRPRKPIAGRPKRRFGAGIRCA